MRFVEPVEPTAIRQERLTLFLEDLPDSFINGIVTSPSGLPSVTFDRNQPAVLLPLSMISAQLDDAVNMLVA
ncbi:MAG TPA: hypothetical protein VMU78_01360 [Methylocella sp.]|nr:hypothetical protein [Methylocella sp.]